MGNVNIGGVYRLLLVGAMLDLLLPGQQTRRFGPIEVVISSGEIAIRRGTREWKINIVELPVHANDCEDPQESASCRVMPKASPCYACIRSPEVFAVDEPHQALYFAVATGTSKNRPWIIFRYSLRTHGITRIVSDYGGGFSVGEVSRSGQYLAYIGYAKMGVCGTQSSIAVVDLWARRLGAVPYPTAAQDDISLVRSFRWTSLTHIEYDTEVHRESECREGDTYAKRQFSYRVDVAQIEFR